nr:hypothetical protein 13 [Gammaproteobacteria bacterium]
MGRLNVLMFPNDSKIVFINNLDQAAPNLEYAFLSSTGSGVSIKGNTERVGDDEDFTIVEIFQ